MKTVVDDLPTHSSSPTPTRAEVARVYDERPDFQWRRLDTFPCEFHVHRSTILESLPSSSRVLDVGAGPGRYALELARAGHRVTLGDLSQEVNELARRRLGEAGFPPGGPPAEHDRAERNRAEQNRGEIEAVLELDACDLGRFESASFDAVVALGPFYHLGEAHARQRAAEELARVLRPGGLLFAAFKPRTFWLSLALHTFVTHPEAPAAQLEHLEQFLDDGHLRKVKSPQLKRSWFCRLEEIEPLFAPVGIRRRQLLASSGIVAPWTRPGTWAHFQRRDPELRERLLELVRRTADDPHVLGMSDQVLFVGQRAGDTDESEFAAVRD